MEVVSLSKKDFYEQKTEELINPLIEESGFELVDVEYVKEAGNYYLRVYIDKPGGITVDDCEVISRSFNDILDSEDYIEDSYIFEVSSPGLGRPLKKDRDFERSIGKEVDIKLYKAVDHSKDFTGVLVSYDGNTVVIETDDEKTISFEKKEIALIRLSFDF